MQSCTFTMKFYILSFIYLCDFFIYTNIIKHISYSYGIESRYTEIFIKSESHIYCILNFLFKNVHIISQYWLFKRVHKCRAILIPLYCFRATPVVTQLLCNCNTPFQSYLTTSMNAKNLFYPL